jgi:hypothetical protein
MITWYGGSDMGMTRLQGPTPKLPLGPEYPTSQVGSGVEERICNSHY